MVVIVQFLSWHLVDPLIAGQSSEHVNIVLVNSGSGLRSLHIQVAKLKPLSLLNAVHLCFLDESFLSGVSAYCEHHFSVFVIDQAVPRTRTMHWRDLNDLKVLVIVGDGDNKAIVGRSHLLNRFACNSSGEEEILL